MYMILYNVAAAKLVMRNYCILCSIWVDLHDWNVKTQVTRHIYLQKIKGKIADSPVSKVFNPYPAKVIHLNFHLLELCLATATHNFK